jgi:hypothetical protein
VVDKEQQQQKLHDHKSDSKIHRNSDLDFFFVFVMKNGRKQIEKVMEIIDLNF